MPKNQPPLSGGFLAHIPRQIDAESNPRCPHLADFPRNILYTRIELCDVRGACYWPDVESYREDADTRELRYVPRQESPYSVRVVYEKATGAWTVVKSRDTAVVCQAHGTDFRTAMMHATTVGVAADEPADIDGS